MSTNWRWCGNEKKPVTRTGLNLFFKMERLRRPCLAAKYSNDQAQVIKKVRHQGAAAFE
jgi:hypothetical protein